MNFISIISNLPTRGIEEDPIGGSYIYSRRTNDQLFVYKIPERIDGVPFGCFPREILMWINNEVLEKKSKEIFLGESYSDFLRRLMPESSGELYKGYHNNKEQLLGILGMSCCIYYSIVGTEKHDIDRIIFSKEWNDSLKSTNEDVTKQWIRKIILDDKIYDEILSTNCYFNRKLISETRLSTIFLDLFMWISYLSAKINDKLKLSFDDLMVPICSSDGSKRSYKQNIQTQLKRLQEILGGRFSVNKKEGYLLIYPSSS